MHVITLALFATQNANDEKIRVVYLAKARALIAPLGMRIESFTRPDENNEFPGLPRGGVHDADLNSIFHDCDVDATQAGLTQLRLPAQHLDPSRRAYISRRMQTNSPVNVS